jgi:hypothetical protein
MEEEERNDEVTVGATPILICTERTRQELNLANISAGGQVVKLIIGKQPTAFTGAGGVYLIPTMTYWATSAMGFKPTNKAIWAVASAAGAVVAVLER